MIEMPYLQQLLKPKLNLREGAKVKLAEKDLAGNHESWTNQFGTKINVANEIDEKKYRM